MDSPTWKPGILIVLVLLSCLFAVESALTKPALQKKPPQKKTPIVHTSTKKTTPRKSVATPGKPTSPNSKSPAKTGGNHPPPRNAAEWEKQEFLAAHNKIRFIHGEPPFRWDPKLALYAKQYSAQRYNDCQMVHSTGPYGENLFWGSGNKWRASDAVKYWADEYKYYNGPSNACQSGKMCGHYTQIVWRDSVRLGCVRSPCKNGGTYIVCEYDPPGNYFGENPFDSHSR